MGHRSCSGVVAHAASRVGFVPEGEETSNLFFMRLLRDADKLDIWKVVVDYYQEHPRRHSATIELDLPDPPTFSPAALACLKQRQMVNMASIRTLNDFKLLQIGWVYDLNFAATFRSLKEKRYIQQIAATLPQTAEVRQVVDLALNHVADKAAAPV